MNSRVSLSNEGIDPSVRERAEAAARRAGMSLNDWLNSTIGPAEPPSFRARPEPAIAPGKPTQDVADIHARLDSITRQIEQISQPAPRHDPPRGEAAGHEYGVARQLNEAISRLDARLAKVSRPAAAKPAPPEEAPRAAAMASRIDRVERAAAELHHTAPPQAPMSLDFAVAEIEARQNELDGGGMAPQPYRAPSPSALSPSAFSSSAFSSSAFSSTTLPPTPQPARARPAEAPPPAAPGPDFSILERHLVQIASQIEALQRPDWIEQSIAAFRAELAEIRHAITEAMPRQAIESIEKEIRSLARRIDDTRHNGIDSHALAGVERALGEIREVLRSLTTAEQLSGYDEAIRNLGGKLDVILRSSDDPSTVQQLEGAIAALRAIVSNVASNDMLARLNEDVRTLATKVDQLTHHDNRSEAFVILEQRIAALTSALESRERPAAGESTEQLEAAVRALSGRLDRMPVGNDDASAFVHLEQRISYLLERLEASANQRGGHLGRVEDGLQDILRHLEAQHATFVALAENSRRPAEASEHGLADMVKRGLSDLRFSQSEADRHTQDALETVHNALGHVVDRLAMIEGDLRSDRNQPAAPQPEAALTPRPARSQPAAPRPEPTRPRPEPAPRLAMAPQQRPELPNPAAAQEHFAAAPREFHAAPSPVPAAQPAPARAISEILEPHLSAPRSTAALAPDHPLEPGTRPAGRPPSPSERIAASESAISGLQTAAREPANASSFIAAARRAAQAAAAATPAGDQPSHPPAKAADDDGARKSSTITGKIRALLVGASVVIIVLGTFKLAMSLLDGGNASVQHALENTGEPPPALAPAETGVKPAIPTPSMPSSSMPSPSMPSPSMPGGSMPSMTSPTRIDRQSSAVDRALSVANAPPPSAPATTLDPTGSIVPLPQTLGWVQIPATEKLPDAIGGSGLRATALRGDPTAAYEIGVRFAEGKGVAPNFDAAAKWYDRAAQAGVVPAMFRLGTLYEKGLGVKRDIDLARRYYLQAAERGNAKAMHNLAVLAADGGGAGADYRGAAQWFRKAADRGIADSQFNLGILYARGIGVEQNLAESFKWFSLAAAQGDADAGRKRDDIAKRLDAQSLAAAKLSIQTFTPELQPDDAINVATPAGGWDSAPADTVAVKPASKPAAARHTAAAH